MLGLLGKLETEAIVKSFGSSGKSDLIWGTWTAFGHHNTTLYKNMGPAKDHRIIEGTEDFITVGQPRNLFNVQMLRLFRKTTVLRATTTF